MEPNSLSQFYTNLKTNLDQPTAPTFNVRANPATFNTQPADLTVWKNKCHHHCHELKDKCAKHIILDIYCKILPHDKEYIDGHRGLMGSDIDAMLTSKNMTPTQYLKSAYESTKAPLLGFINDGIETIGKTYMEAQDEVLKDAQENDVKIGEPEEPDETDDSINNMLVDIKNDTEYDDFIEVLKKKTVEKIVSDISAMIDEERDKNDMVFDTKNESAVIACMDYMQKKLWNEKMDITPEMKEEMIGLSIREAALRELDLVFNQTTTSKFNEFASKIRFGKGILINESAIKAFTANS